MARKYSKAALQCGVACISLICASASWAQAKPIDIPAEDAGKSIPELARQAGVQIIAPGQALHGVVTPAVKGEYEVRTALTGMLKGTDLRVAADDGQTIVLAFGQKKTTAAPTESGAGSQSAPVESVVVTGSRVITNGADSPTPVTVVSVQQLAAITPSNIPDALNKQPVFAGSSSQRNTGGPTGNGSGNFLNLRGFGSQRTLILLDGNRVPATSTNGTVDINTLPQMLMSRVDIVTGGASAVYGSDAVTGVVNFILNKKFEGLKLVAQGGLSARGDDASYKFGIAAGASLFGGRGHAEFSYEHYNSDGIHDMNKRRLGPLVYTEAGAGSAANPFHLAVDSRLAAYTPGGYVTSSNPALNDHFFQTNGVLVPFTHGLPTGSAGDESGGDGGYAGQGFPESGANPWLLASLRTDQLFARFDYDLSDNIHAYVQANGAQDYNYNSFFTQWFGANVASGNPYLPSAVQAVMGPNETFNISKTIQDAPGYAAQALTTNLDVTVGLNGTFADRFNWDLHYTHGYSRLHDANPHNINQQRLTAALDSVRNGSGQIVCRVSTTAFASLYPGCIPYNPFGPNAETAGAIKYIDDYTDFTESNTMDDVAGGVSGDLFTGWAGPVRGALSGEFRSLSLQNASIFSPTRKVDCSTLNPLTCSPAAQFWTSNIVGPMAASETVWEGAAELDVPLLRDLPLVQSLEFNSAGRYTQYSVSGAATTWKAGLVWTINDDFRLRGTASRDIRAPTLFDLFSPTSSGLSGFTDLHFNPPAGYNPQAVSQGNPTLKPEVARTNTLGGIYKPSWLPGLTVSADWYMINIANAITSVDGRNATIQAQCEASNGTSPYCLLYVRPLPFSDRTPANRVTAVLSQSLNVAKTSTHGIDGEVNYNFDLNDVVGWQGNVMTRLLVSYQPVLQSQILPGAVVTNAAGAVALAAGRVTFDVGYTNGPLGINFEERYHSSERQSSNPTLVYSDPSVPDIYYSDLTLTYRFKLRQGDPDESTEAFLSMQNLFDQQPHTWISTGLTGSQGFAYPTPTDEDVVGRYVTAGLRLNL